MAIQGSLETFDLSSLLQMLCSEKKTGKLTIRSKTNTVQIFFQQGDIVFARESKKSRRIGLLISNNGLVTRQVLEQCLEQSRQKTEFIGKTLVENGHISLAQLNSFLLKQAENTIYNVFLWRQADFVYEDARIDIKALAGRKFSTMNLLLEASRRIDELEVLKEKIPDDRAVIKISANPDGTDRRELSSEEQKVLSLIRNRATVREVIDETGWDDFTGYKTIHSLASSGLIGIERNLPADELASGAVNQLQGIDGRQFRETLDHMGLRRSSILRIALTRIFRDAADKDQLLESVRQEAVKLVSAADKDELECLRQETRQPFIKPIVELLGREAEKN
ncbi:MAG: DUF4388 domain-containing protein [Desulfosalsimonas sp.]